MKAKKFVLSVPTENIRKLVDPLGEGHESYYAYVRVGDLPLDLPLEANPRTQDTQSRVSKQIRSGLTESPEVFHLLNRGLTISALRVEYDNRSQQLTLEFPE